MTERRFDHESTDSTDRRPADRANGGRHRLELLFAEYVERRNAGEGIDPQEIIEKYPDLAAELLRELDTYESLESLGAGATAGSRLGTVGDYTLRRRIGRGGMGVVYDAWQGSLDRRVALKVLPAGIAADNKAFVRFMREAKTAAQLGHPNIVHVHSVGLEENTPFYAMEYIEGETLAQLLGRVWDAEPQAETRFGNKDSVVYFGKLAEAFADVADGLQHAHAKGVVHRDIKPSNLILDGEGRLRILDFGLARLEGEESLTLSGDFVGTPLYMSPEQARRKKVPVDHRTDVYSLGATMYEALAGRPPFRGKDHADTLSQIIDRDPTEPRKLNPRVPKDLETIVLKCLRKDAGDRYGTAEAVGQDLRRFVRGDVVEARREPRWKRTRRALWHQRWILATAAVLAVAISFAAVLWHRAQHAESDKLQLQYRRAVTALASRLSGAHFRLDASVASRSATIPLPGITAGKNRFAPVSRNDLRDEIARGSVSSVEAAARQLEQLVRRLPNLRDGHYHLAIAYRLLGREEESKHEARAALAIDPGFVPAVVLLPGPSPWDEPSAIAIAEHEPWIADWLEAKRPHRPAERMGSGEPKRAAAWTRLIERTQIEGEPYAGCLLEAYLNRGVGRLASEDPGGALRDFSVAEHLAPASLEPRLLQSKAYLMLERPEDAERLFEALVSEKSTGKIRRSEVAIWVSSVYASQRDFSSALWWARKVPASRVRERLLSHLHRQLGDYGNALAAARRALHYAPDSYDSHRFFLRSLVDTVTDSDGGCEDCLELIKASEEVAHSFPEESSAMSFVRVARVLCHARRQEYQTEDPMRTNSWCLTALAAALAGSASVRAGNVVDDFADGDLFNCEPVCWTPLSCCPVGFRPREDGIDMWNTSDNGAWVFANDLTCSRVRGVRIQARVTVGTLAGARGPNLGFTDGIGLLYVANFRDDHVRLRLVGSGGEGELMRVPIQVNHLDLSERIVVELELGRRMIEMRMWQAGDERPAQPALSLQHARFLAGHPCLSVFDEFREPIVIHEVEVTEVLPPAKNFRRGDCNGDSAVNITDVISFFDVLFRGQGEFTCEDACDANDDGKVDISDGVTTLGVLFRGQGSIPSPGMEACGVDPGDTADELGCEEFEGCP